MCSICKTNYYLYQIFADPITGYDISSLVLGKCVNAYSKDASIETCYTHGLVGDET